MVDSFTAHHLRLQRGPRWLIDDVSLTLTCGELVALIGPNGAGKSTLLRLLTGYLSPAQGECMMGGRPLANWTAAALSRRRAVIDTWSTRIVHEWTTVWTGERIGA